MEILVGSLNSAGGKRKYISEKREGKVSVPWGEQGTRVSSWDLTSKEKISHLQPQKSSFYNTFGKSLPLQLLSCRPAQPAWLGELGGGSSLPKAAPRDAHGLVVAGSRQGGGIKSEQWGRRSFWDTETFGNHPARTKVLLTGAPRGMC